MRNFGPGSRFNIGVSEPKTCDPMENPLALWLGVALYAAIGLFGIFVFHDSASIQDLTTGYGVAYRTIASSETAT
jgi:hypothetical protein